MPIFGSHFGGRAHGDLFSVPWRAWDWGAGRRISSRRERPAGRRVDRHPRRFIAVGRRVRGFRSDVAFSLSHHALRLGDDHQLASTNTILQTWPMTTNGARHELLRDVVHGHDAVRRADGRGVGVASSHGLDPVIGASCAPC